MSIKRYSPSKSHPDKKLVYRDTNEDLLAWPANHSEVGCFPFFKMGTCVKCHLWFNWLVTNLITKAILPKWCMFLLRSFHFCKGSLQQGGSRLGSNTELLVSQKVQAMINNWLYTKHCQKHNVNSQNRAGGNDNNIFHIFQSCGSWYYL